MCEYTYLYTNIHIFKFQHVHFLGVYIQGLRFSCLELKSLAFILLLWYFLPVTICSKLKRVHVYIQAKPHTNKYTSIYLYRKSRQADMKSFRWASCEKIHPFNFLWTIPIPIYNYFLEHKFFKSYFSTQSKQNTLGREEAKDKRANDWL